MKGRSTKTWQFKTFKKCSDCPAMINGLGGRQRCIPCADIHADKVKRNYKRK